LSVVDGVPSELQRQAFARLGDQGSTRHLEAIANILMPTASSQRTPQALTFDHL
jgi:hypothetical protein